MAESLDELSNGSGYSSSVILPNLVLSPEGSQSVAVGTPVCFTANGTISLPQRAEGWGNFVGPCWDVITQHYIKTCGTNGTYDAEAVDPDIIYNKQPFSITVNGGTMSVASPPPYNTSVIFGVKSTNGYRFWWEIYQYCNATPSCSARWFGYAKMTSPNGVITTLSGGFVETYQDFRIKSNSGSIIWEFTTQRNWAYNYKTYPIPSDAGDFQFFLNAMYLGNVINDIRTSRGSYQGTISPNEFIWTSTCSENLEINGNTACYTPLTPSGCQVCVSTLGNTPLCRSVISSPLYIRPKDEICILCDTIDNCLNIPNPTTPSINEDEPIEGEFFINWDESLSYTSGLKYEVSINTEIIELSRPGFVFNDYELNELYTIKVRAVDDCGESNWSNEIVIDTEE